MLLYQERGEKKWLRPCVRKGMLEGTGNDMGLWVRNIWGEEEGRGTVGIGEATLLLQLPLEGFGNSSQGVRPTGKRVAAWWALETISSLLGSFLMVVAGPAGCCLWREENLF